MLSVPFAAGWPRRMPVSSRCKEGTGAEEAFPKEPVSQSRRGPQWSDIGVYARESLFLYIRLLLNSRDLTTHSWGRQTGS